MEEIYNNPLKDIEQRINNFEIMIDICQYEIAKLLEQKDKLLNVNKIGFKFNPKSDEEKFR